METTAPNILNTSPLADRLRPETLADFLGQDEIVGSGKLLRQAITGDQLPSMIFWGPPGSGKTTLAHIIARQTKSEFLRISAVTSGLKDLRLIIKKAKENSIEGKKTILFIDEIHRWNKAQQDALLPQVERGVIILIGATTENPSFEVRGALLSRCRVFVLKQLDETQIGEIIKRALADKARGLGVFKIKIDAAAINLLARLSNGDARAALNVLEYAATSPQPSPSKGEGVTQGEGSKEITAEIIKEAFQKSHLLYDKDGDEHYNIISALHKAMRGSDADAALYWLARMTEAGEDPLYIARRLVRFASEDIGLANSRALEQAVAAYQACHFIGLPEGNVILAQAVVYMAKCEKSNDLYIAYKQAAADVHEYGNLPVPLSIRNAPTKLMKELGYGQDYKYSPDYDYKEKQDYLPGKLRGRKYFKVNHGQADKK
ncbi:AAA family ATPase [Candidatus Falkowbacteria bacterium RIFCSPLOWO2_12_FULL_45_13]|uniref:Replication-associated recombination protein A n=2 Tax=Candidatus Falkowiibacteriota TaxID=1752728 RepID=A0A1F5SCU7_9BACT|nr:MAG: AAA family ATPase [Candidatus Falkowbacteria bacterium RIFCSPLOWO2_02_FULL_45_21]OGF29870.1 MAG: AAA family ATPase [Candidatus Falkowbacteria bacterium RIFCSPLOWO2_12_FULL_45_13]